MPLSSMARRAARIRSTASGKSKSGLPGSPVESSIEIPASPVLTASATLAPTSSGSMAKPPRKSPLTGTGTPSASARKCASVCSSDDCASRRPCDHANPELVEARAGKPSPASTRALPTSQGLGMTKQPGFVEMAETANAIGGVGHGGTTLSS